MRGKDHEVSGVNTQEVERKRGVLVKENKKSLPVEGLSPNCTICRRETPVAGKLA